MMSSTETLFFSKKVIKKYSLCFLFFQLSIDCCPTYSVIQDLLRNEKKDSFFSQQQKKMGQTFLKCNSTTKKEGIRSEKWLKMAKPRKKWVSQQREKASFV